MTWFAGRSLLHAREAGGIPAGATVCDLKWLAEQHDTIGSALLRNGLPADCGMVQFRKRWLYQIDDLLQTKAMEVRR